MPHADLRLGSAEHLPWPDNSFDLVTSINALQFADNQLDALAEMARVARRGGQVAISNWAEDARNDLATIENALAHAADEDPLPDSDLRRPGGLRQLFADGQLDIVSEGVIDVPWDAADDDTLVRAVLLGEDPATIESRAPVVVEAARPFRTESGSYHLDNAFRYAVGRTRRIARGE